MKGCIMGRKKPVETETDETIQPLEIEVIEEDKPKVKTPPKVKIFKNNPVLHLNPDVQFGFSFGLGKAKLILANIRYIQQFVDEFDGTEAEAA